jgi:DNA polymerase III delta prime subunit
MPEPIAIYDGTDRESVQQLVLALETSYKDAPKATATTKAVQPKVPEFSQLIGVDPEVYRQINAAIGSGKRHLMFYGPPGTGKTTLAELVASALSDKWKLITGSSDWNSQDIIGGYQPIGGGQIKFMAGVLLENFDRPLIIDELNRCDIDKVIGPLFTVLSGQATSLPYFVTVGDPNSPRITILPNAPEQKQPHQYAPTSNWRLIATINSIDKASLYQMSYALTRRFAWILVDVPPNLPRFFWEYLKATGVVATIDPAYPETPVSRLWGAVNSVRKIGPAPIIDIVKFLRQADPAVALEKPVEDASRPLYLDGFYTFLLPMLDGIRQDQAEILAKTIIEVLGVSAEPAKRLTERLAAVAL